MFCVCSSAGKKFLKLQRTVTEMYARSDHCNIILFLISIYTCRICSSINSKRPAITCSAAIACIIDSWSLSICPTGYCDALRDSSEQIKSLALSVFPLFSDGGLVKLSNVSGFFLT